MTQAGHYVLRIGKSTGEMKVNRIMKKGKSLLELATALTHIRDTAKDFVVPTEKLSAEVVTNQDNTGDQSVALTFTNGVKHSLSLTPWSSSQLAGYTDIPKAYFDRINAENPYLAADNINHGLARVLKVARDEKKPESRMVRTVDGKVRDIVLASLKPENFNREIDRLKVAAGLQIKNFDLPEVVELTMRATGLTGENKKNSILAALASGNEGAGLTQWGLINSFTRAAQDDAIDDENEARLFRVSYAMGYYDGVKYARRTRFNVFAETVEIIDKFVHYYSGNDAGALDWDVLDGFYRQFLEIQNKAGKR